MLLNTCKYGFGESLWKVEQCVGMGGRVGVSRLVKLGGGGRVVLSVLIKRVLRGWVGGWGAMCVEWTLAFVFAAFRLLLEQPRQMQVSIQHT